MIEGVTVKEWIFREDNVPTGEYSMSINVIKFVALNSTLFGIAYENAFNCFIVEFLSLFIRNMGISMAAKDS